MLLWTTDKFMTSHKHIFVVFGPNPYMEPSQRSTHGVNEIGLQKEVEKVCAGTPLKMYLLGYIIHIGILGKCNPR